LFFLGQLASAVAAVVTQMISAQLGTAPAQRSLGSPFGQIFSRPKTVACAENISRAWLRAS